MAAGLHLLVTLPPGMDEEDVTERAARAGVGVYPLGRYRAVRRDVDRHGLVLGYSTLTPEQADAGVAVLAGLA